MVKAFLKLKHKIYNFIGWALNQKGTPAQRARGIAVGVFSGCFPLFGFQTFIGIFLASFVKGNHLLAVVGTWISNPFTYLPLYWFNYKIGTLILGGELNLEHFHQLTTHHIWSQSVFIVQRMLLGSALVGSFLGSIGGLSFYLILKRANNRLKKK